MKAPRGFGKRYFSLLSIQAHSVAPVQQGAAVALRAYPQRILRLRESDDDPPDDPPLPAQQTALPCHCDCHFRRRTALTLRACRKKSACNCKCRFYSFRRSGVHPPKFSFLFSRSSTRKPQGRFRRTGLPAGA